MRCSACKFWREVSDQLLNGHGFGACRRRAPSPTFENFMGAARTVEHCPTESGAEPYSKSEWSAYLVNWPVTDASDFCGDFVPAKSTVGFV